jgi:hypothetical protein
MKVAYYLNEGRKKNLYCRISDGAEKVTFSLDYSVDPEKWNAKKEELDSENEYYFTLIDFKKYLTGKYHELKNESQDNIMMRLKNEALLFTKEKGIDGIAERMFDYFNKDNALPKYAGFVQAFEKFSGLKKGEYKIETVDPVIHFHTKENTYEIDTYEGLTCSLKSFIEDKSYDEIFTQTNVNIWSEIYIDAGIEKHVFLPELLSQWEEYWNNKYRDIKEKIGKTSHLDELKRQSWRQFQVYMACYDDCGDAIKLAYEIDDIVLYPISVITMMNIFDAETCYGEYCEFEFEGNPDWESISLDDDDDDDDDNSPIFYIRTYEF